MAMTTFTGFRMLWIVVAVMVLALALSLLAGDPVDTLLRLDVPAVGASAGAVVNTGPGAIVKNSDKVSVAMQQQLGDVVRAYAENTRYPEYSKPLNANDWNLLHPRAFVARKAALANTSGMTATIVIDRYIVDRNVDLPVQVQVAAKPGAEHAALATRVAVWLQQKGQRSAPAVLADRGASGEQAFAGIVPASVLQSVSVGETAVLAEVQFSNGERSVVTAMVKLYERGARLVRLGDASVDGADLVIPAYFEVTSPGRYRVEANLFSAAGNEPVSHLNAEFPLSAEARVGLMKVHAVTLRAKGAAGPYVLRDIDISRQPDQPGDATGYGTTAAESFTVRGFPLASYSSEPWQDPAAQQRLDFLKKLADAKSK